MDPTRKEYGSHIFARVNIVDHVFWVRTRVFFGFGAIEAKIPQKNNFLSYKRACGHRLACTRLL